MPDPNPSALDLALPLLRCPVCEEPLSREDAGLRCPNRHSFDLARQGYASLLTGRKPTSGDDAAMVGARLRFLETGTFAPILADLVALADGAARSPATVVDAGCGTGYYLAGTLDAFPNTVGVGLDSSTFALRAAARSHPRAAAIACDLFGALPLASSSADLVLDVFAPRNPAEFHRVLRPEGTLLVARPTERHLAGMRQHFPTMTDIDPVKEERLERALGPYFEPIETVTTEHTAEVTTQAAADLLLMTPGARAAVPSDPDLVDLPAEIEVSVLTTAYRRRRSDPVMNMPY